MDQQFILPARPELQVSPWKRGCWKESDGISIRDSVHKFRWNLSGTYQQYSPDMYQTDRDETTSGNSYGIILGSREAVGCNFSRVINGHLTKKDKNYGSSLIDLLVYHETVIRGRRDF